MKAGPKILIVEDEFIVAMTMKDELADAGFDVVGITGSADRAVEIAAAALPDVVLLDVRLKGQGDGVDAAYRIRALGHGSAVIFVTGSSEPAIVGRMQEFGPSGIVMKPVAFEDVERAIQAAIGPDA